MCRLDDEPERELVERYLSAFPLPEQGHQVSTPHPAGDVLAHATFIGDLRLSSRPVK